MKRKGKHWSKEEDSYIRDNYSIKTNADIAKDLDRNTEAVRKRLNYLKLKRRRYYEAIADSRRRSGASPKTLLQRGYQYYEFSDGKDTVIISTEEYRKVVKLLTGGYFFTVIRLPKSQVKRVKILYKSK